MYKDHSSIRMAGSIDAECVQIFKFVNASPKVVLNNFSVNADGEPCTLSDLHPPLSDVFLIVFPRRRGQSRRLMSLVRRLPPNTDNERNGVSRSSSNLLPILDLDRYMTLRNI